MLLLFRSTAAADSIARLFSNIQSSNTRFVLLFTAMADPMRAVLLMKETLVSDTPASPWRERTGATREKTVAHQLI